MYKGKNYRPKKLGDGLPYLHVDQKLHQENVVVNN